MLIAEKGVQFSRHCEGCHNPIALFSGDLSQGMPKKRPFEDEGITCSVCHAIQSTDTTGTGSYVMGVPPSWSMKKVRQSRGRSPILKSSATSIATSRP